MIFMNDSYTEITNRNHGEGINRGDHLTTCGVENIMEKKILLPNLLAVPEDTSSRRDKIRQGPYIEYKLGNQIKIPS